MRETNRQIDAETLRRVMDYDPLTGIFLWKIKPSMAVAIGDRVGAIGGNGYRTTRYRNVSYRNNRLAWLWMKGSWPTGVVDHLNCDKTDDRFKNLRDVSELQNSQNERHARVNSSTGLLGVSPHYRGEKRFRADIRVNGKNLYLGLFHTAEEAHLAYVEAKRKHHSGCTL